MSSTCRVAATSWARTSRTPSQAATAVVASVPVTRSDFLPLSPSVSAMNFLLDTASSTGQPVSTSAETCPVSSSEW